eukprot:11253688-Alexandrium_andersonii.AAC.1
MRWQTSGRATPLSLLPRRPRLRPHRSASSRSPPLSREQAQWPRASGPLRPPLWTAPTPAALRAR